MPRHKSRRRSRASKKQIIKVKVKLCGDQNTLNKIKATLVKRAFVKFTESTHENGYLCHNYHINKVTVGLTNTLTKLEKKYPHIRGSSQQY